MKTRPITPNCLSVLEERTHVCFGISPFNSYFSDQRILELASWGKKEFESMHFFVPDVPSAFTLEALGYTPEKAAWKARRQAQYLHNKIQKSLLALGFSHLEAEEMFLGWEKLSNNKIYLSLYKTVQDTFETNLDFREACLEASKWVLEKRTNIETLTPTMLESACRYLLAEIPLFMGTAAIVGAKTSVFCYHQCIPFLENLFHNRFPVAVGPRQGFAVIQPSYTNEIHHGAGPNEQEQAAGVGF